MNTTVLKEINGQFRIVRYADSDSDPRIGFECMAVDGDTGIEAWENAYDLYNYQHGEEIFLLDTLEDMILAFAGVDSKSYERGEA